VAIADLFDNNSDGEERMLSAAHDYFSLLCALQAR
jgi:hypothetical protein